MRARERRHKDLKKRKNALPAFIIIILGWFSVFYIIYFVDPSSFFALPAFFISVFLSLLFTIATIFANTRTGLIWAILVALFLLMRLWEIGTLLNLALLISMGIVIELYFWEK